MSHESLEVSYNRKLAPLEKLVARVRRTGDFFVQGLIELPMPKVEIEGVGVLSFPIPEEQARKIIKQAERAPYGRGPETILDTSVRKVWQVSPEKARISGKTWDESFRKIVSRVADGLGCGKAPISAQLYKLLIYDEGGFFLSHRDTEKAPGMFGTLVVVLPSMHRGGELVVRHAGREATLDLSAAEVSECAFAAFYADCEHEVRPITKGHRICMVYNLVQERSKGRTKGEAILEAPQYEKEVASASKILEQAFTAPEAPAKLVWLLDHQYTPAELSFATLKNADAARVQVLVKAATAADCTVHLAIVHIEESGSAESNYDGYYSRRSRWNRYDDEEEEENEGESDVDFEIVEVCDSAKFVDGWIDLQDRKVDYGRIPLAEEELLPEGALNGEKPDKKRYMEASGNEGASFERSYHRAALVIWPRDRSFEVLLQAGVAAAIPYLKQNLSEAGAARSKAEAREKVRHWAELVLEKWPSENSHSYYFHTGSEPKAPDRAEMAGILCELGDAESLGRFIDKIVTNHYDGSENGALAKAAKLLGPDTGGALFSRLVSVNMRWFHQGCVDLLQRLARHRKGLASAEWQEALTKVARAIVRHIPEVRKTSAHHGEVHEAAEEDEEDFLSEPEEEDFSGEQVGGMQLDWAREEKTKPVDSELIVNLLDALAELDSPELRTQAAVAFAARPEVFDPVAIIVPALKTMHENDGEDIHDDAAFCQLWTHAATFLLARSEHPPEPPRDWFQEVTIGCKCAGCRGLERFARDSVSQSLRYPAPQQTRAHLHRAVEQYKLDMTHVTERYGRPYTLVFTKTRRAFEQRCRQYKKEIAAMRALLRLTREANGDAAALSVRLSAAIAHN